MSSLIQFANQYAPAAARLAKTPKVQAGFAALLALRLLPWINTWASQRAANNGITDKTWDWSKEIVVVTGGSSGIGANIVRQLEQRDIKVIILDRNPPATKTGTCPPSPLSQPSASKTSR